MNYFPFYYDITGKAFLIIGGGRTALEKADRLRRFTQDIIVVAPETAIEGVRVIRREYREEDLALGDYVIAATGIPQVDRRVAADCRRRGIPVNTVDDRENCDFIFPGIVKRGDLIVAVSTSGTSPAYAMQLRKEIEEILPGRIESILTRMGSLRSRMAERIGDQKIRAAAYKRILALLIASDNSAGDEEIDAVLSEMIAAGDEEIDAVLSEMIAAGTGTQPGQSAADHL